MPSSNTTPEARFIAACRRHGLSPIDTFIAAAEARRTTGHSDVDNAATFLLIDVNSDSDIDAITDLLPDA